MLLGSGHNDASIRLLHYRLAQDQAWRLAFTRQVLAAKFSAHLRLLDDMLADRADQRKALAYTLLHNRAVQIIHTHGLEPLLGFYHETSFGRESLASDLIEVWRPHIDAWVWESFRSQTLREHHFKTDANGCCLDKAGRQVFFAGLETRLRPLGRAMRWQVRGLVQAMREWEKPSPPSPLSRRAGEGEQEALPEGSCSPLPLGGRGVRGEGLQGEAI
jgi:CRISPR/Cas system-associated endonuclease Cas1